MNTGRILITGSEGLVGTALRAALATAGWTIAGLDLRGSRGEAGDVRDRERVRAAAAGCDGIVHLAAVSRVVWGERDPQTCWETNVNGLRNVIEAAERAAQQPWLLFSSSREVYGQPDRLPVAEDAPLRPVNIYGRSKAEGERLAQAARSRGLRAAVVRLSNVYGSPRDHADRVVPAFARAAAQAGVLHVEGAGHTFDFTHLDDAIRGIVAFIGVLANEPPPPIHLLTGRPYTLGQLAALAVEIAGTEALIREETPRSFDVSHFHGDPARARKLLGWAPRVDIRQGLERLIGDFRAEPGAAEDTRAAPYGNGMAASESH